MLKLFLVAVKFGLKIVPKTISQQLYVFFKLIKFLYDELDFLLCTFIVSAMRLQLSAEPDIIIY